MKTRLSLKPRILTTVLTPVIVLILVVAALLISSYHGELRAQQQYQALSAGRLAASLSADFIASGEHHHLTRITVSALEQPGLRWLRIVDATGHPLASAGPAEPSPLQQLSEPRQRVAGTQLWLTVPIYHDGGLFADDQHDTTREFLGWVELMHERRSYLVSRHRPLMWTTVATLASLFIAGALGIVLNRSLSSQFRALRRQLRGQDSASRIEPIAAVKLGGEVDKLAVEIQRSMAGMHSHIHSLQSQIDQRNADLHDTLRTIEVQNTELELARQEAVEASKLKSRFLANTSHEIRTPLHAIIGFGELLLKSESDVQRRESLQILLYSAESLLGIINDLLDFSTLEAGKLKLEQTPLDLRKLAEDVLAMVAPTCMDKELELVLTSNPPRLPMLVGDPLRIKQILTNLIGNAIKFSNEGFVSTRLDILEQNNDSATLKISVSDSGIGLNIDEQAQLFEAFSQANLSTARKFGGNGLGLAIVKGIVEQLHGTISVDSKPGAGSSFHIQLKLPLARGAQETGNFQRLRGRSAVLYESSDLSRQSLIALLASWGMRITTCLNPAKLCEYPADIMILGINRKIAPYIKQYEDLRSAPLLVLAPPGDSYAISQRSFCLPKPVRYITLYNTLCDMLDGKQHHSIVTVDRTPKSRLDVLSVDDNALNQRVVKALLENHGISAVSADSGAAAVAICEKQRFDLVFVDMQMPGMNGYETVERLRKIPEFSKTRIIALSAHAAAESKQQLIKAGIDGYISKPLTMEQLAEVLDQCIPKQSADTQTVDITRCVGLAGNNPQLAQDMLGIMLRDTPTYRERLEEALYSNDVEAIRDIHHQLKGACCYLALPQLELAVDHLEAPLYSQPIVSTHLKAGVTRIIEALGALIDWQRKDKDSACLNTDPTPAR